MCKCHQPARSRACRRHPDRACPSTDQRNTPRMSQLPLSIGRIHFTGIGGIGMSGIAEILHDMGYEVQGSDLPKTPMSSACGTRASPSWSVSRRLISLTPPLLLSRQQSKPTTSKLWRPAAVLLVHRAEMLGERWAALVRRHCRYPRQDNDNVACCHIARCGRDRPDSHQWRDHHRLGQQCPPW